MESGQKMILSNGWWPIQQFSVLAILANWRRCDDCGRFIGVRVSW